MDIRHTPRLYVETGLSAGQNIEPNSEQAHYLLHVLRAKMGDVFRLFNASSGEWRASVSNLAKRSLTLTVHEQTRSPKPGPDLWLCAAPIKKAHFEYMIEKATELGVTVFQPILTARTQIREVNHDRARAIATEAAEQSERLDVPDIRAPLTLDKLVAGWDASRALLVCAEWGDAAPIHQAVTSLPSPQAAILTGPEGGFAAEELAQLRTLPQAVFARLGPRILRADTAALAALASWQALCGDWKL